MEQLLKHPTASVCAKSEFDQRRQRIVWISKADLGRVSPRTKSGDNFLVWRSLCSSEAVLVFVVGRFKALG